MKNQKTQRTISLLLLLIFVFTAAPTAWARSEIPEENPQESSVIEEPLEDSEDTLVSDIIAEPETEAIAEKQELSARSTNLTSEQKAEILNRLGMLKGDPNIGLMLDIKVRRSDAAVFFTRLLGKEQHVIDNKDAAYAMTDFPDTLEGSWYTPYVSYCVSIGLIAGRTDGLYYPDDNISEKEFANVLLKILGYEYNVDYSWDDVYEFSYDIGLFEESSYAVKTEDNRDYYRKDVCDQVFSVLGLEKKNSTKILIEELVDTGSISLDAAYELGFDLSNSDVAGGQSGNADSIPLEEYADIEAIYHTAADMIWVIFTKDVTVKIENIEISQTYDFSKTLEIDVLEMTSRDLLIKTSKQEKDIDYTIDINNVIEKNGENAGMLSFDFLGFNPQAKNDTEEGLTTKSRQDFLAAVESQKQSGINSGSSQTGGTASGGNASANNANTETTGNEQSTGSGTGSTTGNGGTANQAGTQTGTGSQGSSSGSSTGNADMSVDYFRIINAYTTASNQMVAYFSQPISETALNDTYYNIFQEGILFASGESGGIKAMLLENTNNAVKLTIPGARFIKDFHYQLTVSERLVSSYTAKLNEGNEDSYEFKAEAVAEQGNFFTTKEITTSSQYVVEVEFSQAVNPTTAKHQYNYYLVDQTGRRFDISAATVESRKSDQVQAVVRLSTAQPMNAQSKYLLTIVFAQNFDGSASIANEEHAFYYLPTMTGTSVSPIALTSAVSYDLSTVDINFDRKPEAVSAASVSNYSVFAVENKAFTITPVKVYYDPVLTPYTVKLFFQQDKKFIKDAAYVIRVSQSIRDENMASPSKAQEMQFYAANTRTNSPGLSDVVYLGDGIVKLSFSKEIMFNQANISEANFTMEPVGTSGTSGSDRLVPMMAKYIDPLTVILKFEQFDVSKNYRVRFTAIQDYSGQYTAKYPDTGTAASMRYGKR